MTYETYFQMLDALVALAAPDKLSQWQSAEPEARTSQEELDRYNGMFALFLAGEPYKTGIKAQGCGKVRQAVFLIPVEQPARD